MDDPQDQQVRIIPHDLLDPECCGCLFPSEDGLSLVCNECGALVSEVPVPASLEISSATCTHCGALNTFPGFSSIIAFICRSCGEGVALPMSVQ